MGGSSVKDERTGGRAHAEVVALEAAGELATGASLFVSRAVPSSRENTACTDAIIAAGIRSVHIAMADPNPVAGGGALLLKEAGITVDWGERAEQAEPLYRPHRKHATTGLPWVVAKFAASLDGKIATAAGESRWITGPQAREEAHRLRSQVDAVLVGPEPWLSIILF
jgi:diaminohydroxyphosphoribosylaminopyrimidine deaminase/5-amino-6-(5-phosphoribosylamino)uracil reductase